MRFMDWRTPDGCATCRPALNYYLISTWPHEAQDDPQSRFVNERAHANIQKDGTYSVVPRMWGGLTTPPNCAHRRRRREVRGADDEGDRRPAHRPARHQEGRPAAHLGRSRECRDGRATPTARAIRTVKTCVGSEHCRFGTQLAMGMGVKLEKMLFGMWTRRTR
jgi:nitrite reductase (NADH) large subunit